MSVPQARKRSSGERVKGQCVLLDSVLLPEGPARRRPHVAHEERRFLPLRVGEPQLLDGLLHFQAHAQGLRQEDQQLPAGE